MSERSVRTTIVLTESLRDAARGLGINVPAVACAAVADLVASSGWAAWQQDVHGVAVPGLAGRVGVWLGSARQGNTAMREDS